MEIEFLYWEDCPSHPEALRRLGAVMRSLNVEAEIRRTEVATDEEAVRLSFPGSPTIRINGTDIDPAGAAVQRAGLSCRIYHDRSGRVTPLPPEHLIREALAAALEKVGRG